MAFEVKACGNRAIFPLFWFANESSDGVATRQAHGRADGGASKPRRPQAKIVATNTQTLRGASLLFVYAPAGALTKLLFVAAATALRRSISAKLSDVCHRAQRMADQGCSRRASKGRAPLNPCGR